jgi:HSP20 family molecular chaperone IbpA
MLRYRTLLHPTRGFFAARRTSLNLKNASRTVSYFHRALHDTEPPFVSLYHLLEDFQNRLLQHAPFHNAKETGIHSWQPKFDLCESSDSYELHGELPGMTKDNIRIEFTHPQTLVISGKVEKSYANDSQISSPGSGTSSSIPSGDSLRASTKSAAHDNSRNIAQGTTNLDKRTQDTAANGTQKWLRERSVGEFSRIFNFPIPIAADSATAQLRNGILTIFIPKATSTTYLHHYVSID